MSEVATIYPDLKRIVFSEEEIASRVRQLGSEIDSFYPPEDEILVERGNPVEVILRVAKEKSCDLIVMGTHGRGSLADAMMGSTARRVIRRSVKPVLVVRLPEENQD